MTAVAAGAVALAVMGCVVNGRQHTCRSAMSDPRAAARILHSAFLVLRSDGLFLAVWLVIPIFLGGLLLARDRTVFAETRYFIFLAPALCLAWGRALAWAVGPQVARRQRAAGIVLTALVLGITLAALPMNWSPLNRREAWREAAAFVQAHAGRNDAVLIQADYVHPAFERYFGGTQPIFYPFTDRLTEPAQVDGPLAGLEGFSTVWLVQSHHQELDPDNLVAGWFGARYPLVTEVFPAGIAVRGFAQHYRQPAPAPTAPRVASPQRRPSPLECCWHLTNCGSRVYLQPG